LSTARSWALSAGRNSALPSGIRSAPASFAIRVSVIDDVSTRCSRVTTRSACQDGNHRAWMIVDADSKDEARAIVPPPFRSEARIVGLNKFTIDYIDDILAGRRL
jgi:hypothetical protein